jgi:hypothetical protein
MKVMSFHLRGWEEPEMGLVLDENDDWVLVKHLPAEYVVDGYRLYRNKFISNRSSGTEEERVARVLQLKKVDGKRPAGFRFGTTLEMLKWMQDHFGSFEFQEGDDPDLFYGRVHSAADGLMVMEMIDADGHGEVDEDHDHVLEQISVISFGSDYLYSLDLLYKDNLSKNGTS